MKEGSLRGGREECESQQERWGVTVTSPRLAQFFNSSLHVGVSLLCDLQEEYQQSPLNVEPGIFTLVTSWISLM